MLKAFVEKIEQLCAIEEFFYEDRTLTSKPLHPVHAPTAVPLKIHTLSGLSDFHLIDPANGAMLVQVVDEGEVRLISNLILPERQRETLLISECFEVQHRFGQYLPVEDFIVYLQSAFVQDETTAAILRIVGNLTQGVEADFSDGGITQRVTARAGVARVQNVDLPNPVTLRPYRTFQDIEQPEGLFVLRIQAGKDEGPKCKLVEADGGAWKNKAIWLIRDYLAEKTNLQIIA